MKSISLLVVAFFISASIFSQNIAHKVVFSHHNDTATVNPDSIYALSLDGQTKQFITLGYRPRVSHSGRYMAFSNGPLPNSSFDANLWIRDLLTQKDTQIVSNSDYLDYYDFSPNDSEIAYSQGCSMYTTKIDGTNAYHDINCFPCDCFSDDPTVRLSDSTIVYHNVHDGIYTKNYDGSSPQIIPNTVAGDLFPLWSPSGFWIAYFKTTPGAYYIENAIYKIKPSGDSVRLLQLGVKDTLTPDPVWARDMGTIYFIARINSKVGIYKVRTDGSGDYTPVYLFDTTGSVNDYWLGLSDSISSTLSVSLINFAGTFAGKSINLNWQTTQENNSDHFEVEKSLNGNSFTSIGNVAANGNSSVTSSYVYYDNDLWFLNTQHNVVYYRLKEIDKDGSYNFSDVVAVQISNNGKFGVFPNPSNGIMHFATPDINTKLDVIITDASGKTVYQNSFYNTSAGLIQLNNAKGIYLVKIKGDKNIITQKIIVQ